MQGAYTALPAGDRDLLYSVISRPDYLKGTGSGPLIPFFRNLLGILKALSVRPPPYPMKLISLDVPPAAGT